MILEAVCKIGDWAVQLLSKPGRQLVLGLLGLG